MSSLDCVKNALLIVTDNVGHYKALKKTDKYIVWAEDSSISGYGDNRRTTQVISGTADYFTQTENDPNVEAIESAFDFTQIAHRLNSIQYEEVTGYIHYEWIWEVVT